MKSIRWLPIMIAFFTVLSIKAAGKASDPLIVNLVVDQFERRISENEDFNVIEAQAKIGKDINKLTIKLESEFNDDHTQSLEIQTVYTHAISAYWDAQIGYRRDFYPKPENEFLILGIIGLAPYWFEIDAQFFIGESGQYGARLETEYELILTRNQKWVLVPELQINAYAKDDERLSIGSGLSDIELGLRLNYFINRQFAPYIGINWEKKFSDTAKFARDEGEDTNDFQFVIGISGWF